MRSAEDHHIVLEVVQFLYTWMKTSAFLISMCVYYYGEAGEDSAPHPDSMRICRESVLTLLMGSVDCLVTES